jgi:hypothetical protein
MKTEQLKKNIKSIWKKERRNESWRICPKSLLTCLRNCDFFGNFVPFVRNFENKISLNPLPKAVL